MDFYFQKDDGSVERVTDNTSEFAILNSIGKRIIQQTSQGDVTVSTVFLMFDHNFRNDGPPILWETMIFGGKHNGDTTRYISAKDAKLGHAIACQLVWGDKWDEKTTPEPKQPET
jgi:hypothetical protein